MTPPLSKTKRNVYFIFFTLIFLVATPLFILYAKGYRYSFTNKNQVSETGGVYVNVGISGAQIYLNGALAKETSIFQRSTLIQDLKPGVYNIRVSKEGLQPWQKRLTVYPQTVTEAKAFLLKDDLDITEIYRYLNIKTGEATSTKKGSKNNPDYDEISALFATTTSKTKLEMQLTSQAAAATSSVATSTNNSRALNKNIFDLKDGVLKVRWVGDKDSIPSYYCNGDSCKKEITITPNESVLYFDQFPGRDDLIILRLVSGIYVTEIDDRSSENIEKIVAGDDYDFRVKDGKEIYLKQGNRLFSVSL